MCKPVVKYTPEVLPSNQNALVAHVQIRLELLYNAKENYLFFVISLFL